MPRVREKESAKLERNGVPRAGARLEMQASAMPGLGCTER